MTYRLIKYCRREHNIAGGAPMLRLGTLAYYRTLDPSFAIADPGEGTHRLFFPQGSEVHITSEVSNHAFGGTIPTANGDLIVTTGPDAYVSFAVANVYLFCVSMWQTDVTPSLDRAREIDPTYDSMYEIVDPSQFCRSILSAFQAQFMPDWLSEAARSRWNALPSDERDLQVTVVSRPVDYIASRDTAVSSDQDLLKMKDAVTRTLESVFTKEVRDAGQSEYRFAIAVEHKRLGTAHVRAEPLLIPSEQIAGCCRFLV